MIEESGNRRRRKGSGAVTLRDVAQLAGVSPMTVSRAVNSPEQVSAEVRQRVAEAVGRTGYLPNLLAGALSSMRSRMVGLSVPTIAGPVFLDMVQSLTEALFDAGYQLMLGQTGYDNAREDAWLAAILGRRPDAIVLTGIVHSAQARARLLASGIPVVETWDQTPSPIDMLVGFSHLEVGRQVAMYLAQRGRRRLAGVAGDDERAQRRFLAFRQTAEALGQPAVPVATVATPTTIGSGRAGLADLLAREPAIDAVFCSSDALAIGVITEAQARGLRIPEQLAVVGFGDLGFAADLHPSLTSVHIDGPAIGRQAARFIIERLAGIAAPKIVDLGFSIVPRASA
ncbi:MAG: LacI family DNA-binding transcriptional regulator [Burkholderiaceae bacterium]